MRRDKNKTGSLTTKNRALGKVSSSKKYFTLAFLLWVVAMLDFTLVLHPRPELYLLATIGIPLVAYSIVRPDLFTKRKKKGRNGRRSKR